MTTMLAWIFFAAGVVVAAAGLAIQWREVTFLRDLNKHVFVRHPVIPEPERTEDE